MHNWKLPSQLVTTERQKDEDLDHFLHRHELARRIQAEHDLISALDLIASYEKSIAQHKFLAKFLDKTTNN